MDKLSVASMKHQMEAIQHYKTEDNRKSLLINLSLRHHHQSSLDIV
jgi:hypothetical protein